MATQTDLIQIHPEDNVAVALRPLTKGDEVTIGGQRIRLLDAIPAGHKVALMPIEKDSDVRKYGYPIGRASATIHPGEHIHSHNLRTALLSSETYSYSPEARRSPMTLPAISEDSGCRTFEGYRRADGRVGTRNEVWILTTVGCMNRSIERISVLAGERFPDRSDGIFAFTHPFGCSQLGDDLQNTRRLLAGLIRNPNAGGVLIVGLGCENNQMTSLLSEVGDYDRRRVRSFVAQDVDDEVECGVALVSEILDAMTRDKRETCPSSDLVLGVKCGGSDGFSGISANPTVGRAVEIHCSLGGRALMTEVPEMFGAERILMNRAATEGVFQDVVAMVTDFKDYFVGHGQPIYENPSPGNIDSGLTTLEEKSLGAVQKGGRAPVEQVLPYGSSIRVDAGHGGLTLIHAPGNDAVSSTALAAAGATLILFTTGRGTPLGVAVPTFKIASNSDLAQRKSHWIDFDCGVLLGGSANPNALSESLYRKVLSAAAGASTWNEINGYREIAIWKDGVTL